MWKVRRATAYSSTIRKWCSRQESSRVCAGLINVKEAETPRRCFSTSRLVPGGDDPVRSSWSSLGGGFRGFATRVKPSAEESSSELSESEELEEAAAADIKAFTESSESSESEAEVSEEEELEDVKEGEVEKEEVEATAVEAAATPAKKAAKGNDKAASGAQRRRNLVESDRLEAEFWRRCCLLKRDQDLNSVLERWKEEDKDLNQHIVISIIDKLKSTNKFTHALQLMEHVVNDPSFSDFRLAKPLLIEVTARAKGLAAAEKIFEETPEEERTRELYSALLARYVYLENVKKAEALFEQMESLGHVSQSPFAINQMMKMYKQKDDNAKFQEMLGKAQSTSVEPNIYTYNVMLDLKARSQDVEGMEKIYEEIRLNPGLKPDSVTYTSLSKAYLRAGLSDKAEMNMLRLEIGQFRKSKATFEFLMTGYGQLGLVNDVDRMWQKCKAIPGDGFNSFLVFQKAVAMTGDVKRVEAMFKHMDTWKRGGAIDVKRYNNLLLAYYRKGMVAEAKEHEKKMNDKNLKITLSESDKVPLGKAPGIKLGAPGKEVTTSSPTKTKKKAEKKTEKPETKAEKKTETKAEKKTETKTETKAETKAEKSSEKEETKLKKALESAAETGDLKAAETAFEGCRKAEMSGEAGTWNKLLKAYVKAEVPAYGFLQRMEAEKVEPDEETHALLKKLEETK